MLKDVSSDAVLFVVLFDLIPLEDAAAQATSAATNTGDSKAPLAQAEADDETKFQDEGVD